MMSSKASQTSFSRRSSTMALAVSEHEAEEAAANHWRPCSLSKQFHSWEAANVERIIHQEFHLNDAQIKKLFTFRKQTQNHRHWKAESPYTALQFLREWRWKVPAAVKAFDKMIAWRIRNNIDGMTNPQAPHYYQRPQDFAYFPQGILKGTDRQGNPIYVERTGATHLHTLLARHGPEQGLQASNCMREMCTTGAWVQEWEQNAGRGLSGTTTIVDLQGLNRNHMAWSILNLVKDGTKVIQANWPCEANRVIIIRAPALFRYVWSFLKPFLTETVKEMITICTAADPLPELAEYVDLDVLPTCINPDGHGDVVPEFKPIVWEGGPIPPSDSHLAWSPPKRKASADLTSQTSLVSSIADSRHWSPQASPRTVTSLGVGSF